MRAAGLEVSRLDESLRRRKGEQGSSSACATPRSQSWALTGSEAVQRRINLRNEQAELLDRVRALDPDARVVASTQLVLNAVFVEVDASVLPQLAQDRAVVRIAPVANYEMDLSETVPYIGASAVQAKGFTGKALR